VLFVVGVLAGIATVTCLVTAIVVMRDADQPCASDGICESWGSFMAAFFGVAALVGLPITLGLLSGARSLARSARLPGPSAGT